MLFREAEAFKCLSFWGAREGGRLGSKNGGMAGEFLLSAPILQRLNGPRDKGPGEVCLGKGGTCVFLSRLV